MRRVLITGGSGFIGRQVIVQGQAYELHALIHNSPVGVNDHRVDLANPAEIAAAVREIQPEAILHLAAGGVRYGADDMAGLLQVNVMGLQALLEAAIPYKSRVVIAGSWFEYGAQDRPLREDDPTTPTQPYNVSKVAATAIARYYATLMPITVLRVFSVYGISEKAPRLAPYIIEQARQGKPIELTPGDQIRDYVNVIDVAQGFWRSLDAMPQDNSLQILNLGTGQGLQLREFIQTLADVLQENGIPADLRFGAKPHRPNETMLGVADIRRMQAVLQWQPATPLREGLQQMVKEALTHDR